MAFVIARVSLSCACDSCALARHLLLNWHLLAYVSAMSSGVPSGQPDLATAIGLEMVSELLGPERV